MAKATSGRLRFSDSDFLFIQQSDIDIRWMTYSLKKDCVRQQETHRRLEIVAGDGPQIADGRHILC